MWFNKKIEVSCIRLQDSWVQYVMNVNTGKTREFSKFIMKIQDIFLIKIEIHRKIVRSLKWNETSNALSYCPALCALSLKRNFILWWYDNWGLLDSLEIKKQYIWKYDIIGMRTLRWMPEKNRGNKINISK